MPPSPNLETQQRKVVISCFDTDTMDSEVPQHVMVSECFRGSKFIAGIIESLTGFFDDGDEFFTSNIVHDRSNMLNSKISKMYR